MSLNRGFPLREKHVGENMVKGLIQTTILPIFRKSACFLVTVVFRQIIHKRVNHNQEDKGNQMLQKNACELDTSEMPIELILIVRRSTT